MKEKGSVCGLVFAIVDEKYNSNQKRKTRKQQRQQQQKQQQTEHIHTAHTHTVRCTSIIYSI